MNEKNAMNVKLDSKRCIESNTRNYIIQIKFGCSYVRIV